MVHPLQVSPSSFRVVVVDMGFPTMDPFAPCFATSTMFELYSFDDLVVVIIKEVLGEGCLKELEDWQQPISRGHQPSYWS